MRGYSEKDLVYWEERIIEIVNDFGLEPFPQIFEICDHNQMMGYMAYSGMPSRYPHWSFGKHYEKQKTLHSLGLAGLPYEMVINSNPSLAYLMQDNTLLLQILTMAHVYAHNDFFKNNLTFRNTHPEYTLDGFRAHADRIRKYIEDPRIGLKKVEEMLDAAHALSFNCNRFSKLEVPDRKAITGDNGGDRDGEQPDTYRGFGYKPGNTSSKEEVKIKFPAEPDANLLLFIRDHNPFLEEWQRDLLSIVDEETRYFLPQIETKIMNEGWASIWHKRIVEELKLDSELMMEFYVRHNQVVQPIPGGINPYFLGYKLFENIEERWNNPTEEEISTYGREPGKGREKIFQVRQSDRDESFIRQYLTEEMMRELGMFQHEKKGNDRVVTKVSTEEDWRAIKDELIRNTGMNSYPIIKIHDANYGADRRLLMIHEFDQRELDQEYTTRTLRYLQTLWGATVMLETHRQNKKVRLICDKNSLKVENII